AFYSMRVPCLHQHPATDLFVFNRVPVRTGPATQHAQVFLLPEDFECRRIIIGRDNYLGEDFSDGTSSRLVNRTIESHNPTEGGGWISRECLAISTNRLRIERCAGR